MYVLDLFLNDYALLLTLLFKHVFEKLKCIAFLEHVRWCLFEAGIMNGPIGLNFVLGQPAYSQRAACGRRRQIPHLVQRHKIIDFSPVYTL